MIDYVTIISNTNSCTIRRDETSRQKETIEIPTKLKIFKSAQQVER